MPDKHEFLAPSQMLTKTSATGGVAVALAPINPKSILGTWTNVDPKTRDLVKVIVTEKGTQTMVHFYGACTPTPCDWAAVPAMVYATSVTATDADAFTATYKFNFMTAIVTGHLEGTQLIVETFTHFTDHSERSDYYSKDVMHK
jgi:hypothetical protein